jgi:ATP-dependent exoDNAse (exonuclease V) beta subunit
MPLDASLAEDAAARATALTAIDRTLLVEAGAGSGKTSVLAGRVVVLLASGKHPSAIAAISFTEFTAAELRERIVGFIEEILAGRMPRALLEAFPTGRPTAEQQANLEKACEDLDCLVCLTIHGFCRTLLAPYPVETDIDPGAAPLDRDAADLLFEDVCTNWLRKRLSGVARLDNVFEALYLAEPKRTAETLRELAKALCLRRGAEVEACSAGAAADLATLTVKAATFRAFVTAQGSGKCPEVITKAVEGLEKQILEAPTAIEAEMLLWLLRLKAPDGCATKSGGFSAASRVSVKKGWEAILGGGKAMKATIDMLHEQAMVLYEDCKAAHTEMRAAAAGRILEILAAEAREVLADYDQAKRNSAALDFDDLLTKVKDLLAANPAVRSELAARFEAVLVDEFQDTDPVQLEILWRLCGDPPDGNHRPTGANGGSVPARCSWSATPSSPSTASAAPT